MSDGCVVYRPSGHGLGLLLVPCRFGLIVVGLCPTGAGVDAKRQGVAVGHVVQAAVTAAGEQVAAAEQGDEELLRLCLQRTPRELRLRGGLRFRDGLPLLRPRAGASKADAIRDLIDSHMRVEQRLGVLKAAAGNASRQQRSQILEDIRECECALEVLELMACDVLGTSMPASVRRLYDQANQLLREHLPEQRDSEAAPAVFDAQSEDQTGEMDTTQIATEEEEQQQQTMDRPAAPPLSNLRPRTFTSPQSSPPPEDQVVRSAPGEPVAEQRHQPEVPEQNDHAQHDDVTSGSSSSSSAVVKAEQSSSSSSSTDKQHEPSSASSAAKSGRRDEEGPAADHSTKRARFEVIDLTLGDDDDVDDNPILHHEPDGSTASPGPADSDEHSRESVVHLPANSDLPDNNDYYYEEAVSAPPSPVSNSFAQMEFGAGDDRNGDVLDDATVISGAQDTQSQFTEMTHESQTADDPDYEPSQEIDMALLSQSPRTTRSSVGLSQETPDRGQHVNLGAQMDEPNDGSVGNEAEYYHAFCCEHGSCPPRRCEMARAMLEYYGMNVAQATVAMRAVTSQPVELPKSFFEVFKNAFFQIGGNVDEMVRHIRSRSRAVTPQEVIWYFYTVFKPSKTYRSVLTERKLTGRHMPPRTPQVLR